jgi:hypothetical protein
MSFDINDDPQQNQGASKYINKLFKPDTQVRFPAKTGATNVLVMPAFADKGTVSDTDWPTSWVPYRRPDEPTRFNQWAVAFNSWTLIGGRLNLFDPSTNDPQAVNPMKTLFDVANSTPEFYPLVGKGPDGKRLQDGAIPLIPTSSVGFAMNCVETSPRKEDDAGVSRVMTVKRTAFKPAYTAKNGQAADWGLLPALDMKNRGIDSVDPSDFQRVYYWGDITNPANLVPCSISKMRPPSGGMPIYNMTPVEGQTYRATLQMLQTRVELPTIFAQNDPAEIIEILVDIFADYPSLLKRAFERSYPGIDNLLRQTGVVSLSRAHQTGYPQESDFGIPQRQAVQTPPVTLESAPAFGASQVFTAPAQEPSFARPVQQAPQAPAPVAPAAPVTPLAPAAPGSTQTADDIRRSLLGQ